MSDRQLFSVFERRAPITADSRTDFDALYLRASGMLDCRLGGDADAWRLELHTPCSPNNATISFEGYMDIYFTKLRHFPLVLVPGTQQLPWHKAPPKNVEIWHCARQFRLCSVSFGAFLDISCSIVSGILRRLKPSAKLIRCTSKAWEVHDET